MIMKYMYFAFCVVLIKQKNYSSIIIKQNNNSCAHNFLKWFLDIKRRVERAYYYYATLDLISLKITYNFIFIPRNVNLLKQNVEISFWGPIFSDPRWLSAYKRTTFFIYFFQHIRNIEIVSASYISVCFPTLHTCQLQPEIRQIQLKPVKNDFD